VSSFAQGKTRQGTQVKVTFPTLPSLVQDAVKYTLWEEEYSHDILEIWSSSIFETWVDLLKTGVPVEFKITQGPFTRNWIGYVSYVSTNVSAQKQKDMTIVCIGSSFPLKEEATETFERVTIPDVVQSIAIKFGYNYVGDQHALVFDQLTLAGHSYWEWIQEQAKKIGYGVLVDGMTLVFKPLDKMIDYGMTSVPQFDLGSTGVTSGANFIDKTLDSFESLNGEHIESPSGTRTFKVLGGVDPLTSKPSVSIKSPALVGSNLRSNVNDVLFSEIRSDQVAHSYQQTSLLSEGAAHQGRMNMPAYVIGQGDPRVRMFSPVLISGTGPQTDGYWMIKKAKHVFTKNGNYQVELTVATDGTGLASRTYSNQATSSVVGVVNLNEALKNNGQNLNLVANTLYKLTTPLGSVSEIGQGFLRTKARWVYSAKGNGN
jgi:hypothetical protein